jgi:hypothetical protein
MNKGFLTMKNDRLQRVQVGRDLDVPINELSSLWYLWINKDGSWDADSSLSYLDKNEYDNINLIFCVWHGYHRTNLFLMDKNKLRR